MSIGGWWAFWSLVGIVMLAAAVVVSDDTTCKPRRQEIRAIKACAANERCTLTSADLRRLERLVEQVAGCPPER